MAKRPDGTLGFIVGGSRSGKSLLAKAAVIRAPRALVWNIDGEYDALPDTVSVQGLRALRELMCADPRFPRQISYKPASLKDWDGFAELAFAWNLAAPILLIAEELADVTTTSKAQGPWAIVVRRGMKYGMNTLAIAQRGQEIDKTLLGNAKFVHVCRVAQKDKPYVRDHMGVPERFIPSEPLQFVQHSSARDVICHGQITFATAAPRFHVTPGESGARRVRAVLPDGRFRGLGY